MNVETLSIPWRRNLSCEECSTKLPIFRKKKICHFCKNSFCHVCIVRREDKKFCCKKCQILTARPLDRNKLLKLKSRDLINYLTSRQIPTNGCVEKEDLVNVLIKAVNNSCFHPSSTASLDGSTSTYSNSPRNASNLGAQFSKNVENFYNDGIRITGHDSVENEVNGGHSSHYEEMDILGQQSNETEQFRNLSELKADGLPQNDEERSECSENARSEASHFSSDLNDGAAIGDGFSLNRPLMLADIKSRSDLDALSVKQLKELLMRNRTDFKGCVERAELIQKANRLWNDYTVSRKDLENLSLEGLCKICMDAPIECVLLECGHMATCTSCGKQLCECPICRQFVVRCVRTFKA